jgi:hypothetical protein
MNTETVNKLKAAVAQFNEAFEIIDDCLLQAIAESNNRAHHLEGAIGCISDKATLARLNYELDVVNEDQSSLECARDDWFRIAEEYRHRFHVISDRIDEVAEDALSFEDFTANETRFREIQLQLRRDNIRPMTHEERDCLVRKNLRVYAKDVLKLESGASEGVFRLSDKRVVSIKKSDCGIWGWWERSGLKGNIWQLEAIVKDIPSHEALTNVRLHFRTEWMSARIGDTPTLEGLTYHWAGEASKMTAGHENEAVWAQRMQEAADEQARIQFIGNPDDLKPIVIKEFNPNRPANLPAGAFGGIFTDRRVV